MGTDKTNNNSWRSSDDHFWRLFCESGWTQHAYVHPYQPFIFTNTSSQHWRAQSNKSGSDSYSCWSWWRHASPCSHHLATCNSADLQKEKTKSPTKQVWYSHPVTWIQCLTLWLCLLPLLISYSNHYATTIYEASGTDKQSNKFAESKLSTDGNKEEHLYDLPPDSRMQRTSIVTNPPTYKSSTKGFSYLTPNVDDTQFNFSGDLVDPYKSFPHHP